MGRVGWRGRNSAAGSDVAGASVPSPRPDQEVQDEPMATSPGEGTPAPVPPDTDPPVPVPPDTGPPEPEPPDPGPLEPPPAEPKPPEPPAPPGPEPPVLGPGSAGHVLERTRLGGTWVAIGCFAVVLLFLLIFILENGKSVSLSYFGGHAQVPLGVALVLAALGGALLVLFAGMARILQMRTRASRHRRASRRATRRAAKG